MIKVERTEIGTLWKGYWSISFVMEPDRSADMKQLLVRSLDGIYRVAKSSPATVELRSRRWLGPNTDPYLYFRRIRAREEQGSDGGQRRLITKMHFYETLAIFLGFAAVLLVVTGSQGALLLALMLALTAMFILSMWLMGATFRAALVERMNAELAATDG